MSDRSTDWRHQVDLNGAHYGRWCYAGRMWWRAVAVVVAQVVCE